MKKIIWWIVSFLFAVIIVLLFLFGMGSLVVAPFI
jgi:hypothetical protein